MKKYRYYMIRMHFETVIEEEEFLNKKGDEGWRLIMVTLADMGKSYYYFEREYGE